MDSNIFMFPIQHEWKFSEEAIKRLSASSTIFTPSECISKFTKIKEIPGLEYRMILNFKTKNNVSYFNPRILFDGFRKKCIRGKVTYLIKSANFSSKIQNANIDSNAYNYFLEICSVEDLFNPEKKFIVNGECCIEVKGVFYLNTTQKYERRLTLSHYLWNRDDQDFTILVGKENESKTEIKVHKCVLGARSPVFDAMLSTNMKEKAHNIVEIIDFDVQTVKNAIAFCYDQEYGIPFDSITDATSLFQFADKYDIQDLKNRLEEYFIEAASPENICEIANASIISNSPKLRDFCFQTMLLYSKMKFSIDHIEILDKDFAFELFKITFCS